MTTAAMPRARNAANQLGLVYRHEAALLPWRAPIIDAHVHLSGLASVGRFLEVAQWFGAERFWTQTPLEEVDSFREHFGDLFEFVATPNYAQRDRDETWGVDWLRRIEAYRAKGARLAKIWAAPRGLDHHPSFRLDHPTRREVVRLVQQLGMILMVHVADPDTWFAAKYADARKYGTKAEHHERLERLLQEYPDLPVLAAHMAGHPEDLDHLQRLLDSHANLHLDCSATKWMVRELSKTPQRFARFCRDNPGRVLFGTDIVANPRDPAATAHDLYASRYWALRTLLETDYDGPSPIVDPDLSLADPSLPPEATARLRGVKLEAPTLQMLYRAAAQRLLARARTAGAPHCP